MIRTSALVIGAVAMLSAVPANATVIYNTIHPTPAGQTSATALNGANGPVAISFFTSTATTLTGIQLLMNANTANDGGTVFVYLVPDDGTGGGVGKAGAPTGGSAFTGKTLLTSFSDNLLTLAGGSVPPQNASVIDLHLSVPIPAGEYWIGLTNSVGGTAKMALDVNAYSGGTGTAFQRDFITAGPYSAADGGTRVFEAQISTPEPASLAILGAGLAGLGFLRRRRRT